MIEVDSRGYIDNPNATTYNLLGSRYGANAPTAIAIIYYAQWLSSG